MCISFGNTLFRQPKKPENNSKRDQQKPKKQKQKQRQKIKCLRKKNEILILNS